MIANVDNRTVSKNNRREIGLKNSSSRNIPLQTDDFPSQVLFFTVNVLTFMVTVNVLTFMVDGFCIHSKTIYRSEFLRIIFNSMNTPNCLLFVGLNLTP